MSKVRTIILKLFLVHYPVNLKLSLSLWYLQCTVPCKPFQPNAMF